MRISQRLSRRVAFIAILAMLWHAFVPVVHAASMSGAVPLGLTSICSVPGQAYSLEAPKTSNDAPAIQARPQCPICAAAAHAGVALPPAPSLLPALRLKHVRVPYAQLTFRLVTFSAAFLARAPPAA